MFPAQSFRHGLVLSLVLLLTAAAGPAPAEPLPAVILNREAWEWSDADVRTMEAMGKDLKKQRGGYLLETPTWTVDCAVSPRFTVEVAWYVQQFAETLRRTAPMICRPTDPIVPRLTVYNNQRDMQRRTGGAYSSWNSWNRNREELTELDLYFCCTETSPTAFSRFNRSSLQYQVTFALLRKSFKPVSIPPWFNVGHCDYFGSWDMRLSFDENHKRMFEALGSGPMAQRIRNGGDPPRLAEILALNHNQMAGTSVTHINFHYEEAVSLVECLMSEATLREVYETLFERINDDRKPLLTAEQQKLVEATWHTRIKQSIQAAADADAARAKARAEAASQRQKGDSPAAR